MTYKKMPRGYGIIQTAVMRLKTVSIQAKALYSLLASYTGSNDYCFPSIKTMCDDLGLSKPMIIKYLDELESKNLIIRSKLYNQKMLNNNKYEVLFIDEETKEQQEGKVHLTSQVMPVKPIRSNGLNFINNNSSNNNNINIKSEKEPLAGLSPIGDISEDKSLSIIEKNKPTKIKQTIENSDHHGIIAEFNRHQPISDYKKAAKLVQKLRSLMAAAAPDADQRELLKNLIDEFQQLKQSSKSTWWSAAAITPASIVARFDDLMDKLKTRQAPIDPEAKAYLDELHEQYEKRKATEGRGYAR